MKRKSKKILLLSLLFLSFLSAEVMAIEMATLPKNILYVMVNYKKYFNKVVHIAGKKAELEKDEFVIEAFEHEGEALKIIDNRKHWKKSDLFLNIRVDDEVLLDELKKVKEGTPLVITVFVKESAVYDKIIPVFILEDFKILKVAH